MTELAHRRPKLPHPHVTPALARGHLRTCLGAVRLERSRVIREVQLAADREAVLTHLRLLYGLLYHTQTEVEVFLMYAMSTGQLDAAEAVLEGWARNPHRPA